MHPSEDISGAEAGISKTKAGSLNVTERDELNPDGIELLQYLLLLQLILNYLLTLQLHSQLLYHFVM